MSQARHGTVHRRRIHAWLILPLAALMALLSSTEVTQAPPHPELTVMTRNLYLGSSLAPAMKAETLPDLITAVGTIFGTAVFTDFPARARAIADEIAATQPDLVGLQEVSNWTAAPMPVAVNPSANPPDYDFLTILQSALAAEGLHYSVAGVSDNAVAGPLPLVAPTAGCPLRFTETPGSSIPDCVVTFADRDVILVNDDTDGLTVGQPRSGRYATQQVLATPAGPLSFDRGWVSVQGHYQGKSFRMVNTHLETEDSPDIQQAQAAEFLAGPALGGQVIATGDFNSAADGSTTTSYAQLTAPPAFTDAWTADHGGTGLTCCQNETLTNVTPTLTSRIDLILTGGPIRPLSAQIVGDTPFRTQGPLLPIWASDHAGVVATVRIR